MTIEEVLLAQVDQAIKPLNMTRSAFVRNALVRALSDWEALELERCHAQGSARYPVQPGEFGPSGSMAF